MQFSLNTELRVHSRTNEIGIWLTNQGLEWDCHQKIQTQTTIQQTCKLLLSSIYLFLLVLSLSLSLKILINFSVFLLELLTPSPLSLALHLLHPYLLSDDWHDVFRDHHVGGPDEFRGGASGYPQPQWRPVVDASKEHLLHALLDDLRRGVCWPDWP